MATLIASSLSTLNVQYLVPGLGCKAIQGEVAKGDNFCEDLNNNVGCDWDGGDCCGPNVRTGFCTEF